MSYRRTTERVHELWGTPPTHPRIIGISNKAALEKLKPTGSKTVFRTWLQAFPLGVPHATTRHYLLAQAKSAETSGGHGWLMWEPGLPSDPGLDGLAFP